MPTSTFGFMTKAFEAGEAVANQFGYPNVAQASNTASKVTSVLQEFEKDQKEGNLPKPENTNDNPPPRS